VDNWPESETAVRAQAEVAISSIGLANDPAAEAAFNKLISEARDSYTKAVSVWGKIMTELPQSASMITSRVTRVQRRARRAIR
jgi:hypothetical protein